MKAKTNALNVIYFRYTHTHAHAIYDITAATVEAEAEAEATLAAKVTTFAYQNSRFHILLESNQATIIFFLSSIRITK